VEFFSTGDFRSHGLQGCELYAPRGFCVMSAAFPELEPPPGIHLSAATDLGDALGSALGFLWPSHAAVSGSVMSLISTAVTWCPWLFVQFDYV